MAGHSRPKDGVASLAYVPAIHVFLSSQDVDARHEAGHDDGEAEARQLENALIAARKKKPRRFAPGPQSVPHFLSSCQKR
jgi:hypothetical protein